MSENKQPRSILIVYHHTGSEHRMRLAIRHHLHALEASETKHELIYYNAVTDAPSLAARNDTVPVKIPTSLANIHFDAIILHTTFLCLRWTGSLFYGWKRRFDWIGQFEGLKIAIPQDEYDHAHILDEWLDSWGVSVIFSIFGSKERELIYPVLHNKAKFYECLTGYIEDRSAYQDVSSLVPIEERAFDIVYRASHLPYWFGSHGQLKHKIAEIVGEKARAQYLKCDISTRLRDRILGDTWNSFLASGRTVIGCESGSSVFDRRGEIRARINALLKDNAHASFEEIVEQISNGWDDYHFYAISPRHFEAIPLKTAQILVEGRYNDILQPNKHYIPLKKDYSNLDEVLQKVRDYHYLEEIVERAYQDIYISGRYTYRVFASLIEKAIAEYAQGSQRKLAGNTRGDMNDKNRSLEVIERQLIAERYTNELLQARLLDSEKSMGNLIRQAVRNKRALLLSALVIFTAILVISLISVSATMLFLILANILK